MNVQHTLVIASIIIFTACGQSGSTTNSTADSLTEEQRHLASNALKSLVVADGLEVTIMATEPMIKNPTNIDVDAQGRIWVTEAYNYRPNINGNPVNPEGDRIMILEDKDGDGVTETSTVFYQGPEINAPLGVCVLGNRVLISQSPYVWAFYDDNGDSKADRKEIIFQGIGGEQHDHGMHTFTAGPDGKLYFNFGNNGKTLRDKNNNVVLDQDGDSITPKKYKQGMVFRCNPDGSNVECLGNNFRNNYEVAVDSYGLMWQSDNDDDGNRGVRINYVMDYGNYGYTDEMTGAHWSVERTNMEDSIPLQHWHLNDPGVVPNLLQTGSGSPTGMVVYEGTLLPEKFRNQIIHCEPGHNVVRSYPVTKEGAGYTATIENILTGEKDQWFRPADVCVAPDGSLIVADWYDPGVGGHGAGDQQKGRIYRIAPKGVDYTVPKQNFTTAEGAVTALQNPNLATRYLAWNAIQKMGAPAIPALEKVWKSSVNQPMRARAFWALVKMPGGEKYIAEAINDTNTNIKITGLRAARELNANAIEVVRRLVNDPDPQVRRECALALHHNTSVEAAGLWATLAAQHTGKDRWYIEALGIGAADQWENFFEAYLQKVPNPLQTEAGRDIVWRARTGKALPLLATLATDSGTSWKLRQRYFRAFDFHTGPARTNTLIQLLAANKNNTQLDALLLHHLDPKDVQVSPIASRTLKKVLAAVYGTSQYIQLTDQYQLKTESTKLLQLALDKAGEDISVEAMQLQMKFEGDKMLRTIVKGKDTARAAKLLQAISKVNTAPAIDILQEVILSSSYNKTLRFAAAGYIGKSYRGEDRVIQLLQTKQLPAEFISVTVESLKDGTRANIYTKALTFLPGATAKVSENKNVTMNDLLALPTNIKKGLRVFRTNCGICHMVNDEGKDFGPRLSEIGDKLAKQGLLEAIVTPSAAVSFGYETAELILKDGSSAMGIITSKTAKEINMKFPGGSVLKFNASDVKTIKKPKESMMPALHESMSRQELADLLAYLSSLKKQ